MTFSGCLNYFLFFLFALLLKQPRFCFNSYFRNIDLAINKVELKSRKFAANFPKYFLWEILTSFWRCIMIVESYKVFSFFKQFFYKIKQQRLSHQFFAFLLYIRLLIIDLTLYFYLFLALNSSFNSNSDIVLV